MANNVDNGFICAWRYSAAPKHTNSHSITDLLSCLIHQPLGAALGSDTYLPARCDGLLWEHTEVELCGIAVFSALTGFDMISFLTFYFFMLK